MNVKLTLGKMQLRIAIVAELRRIVIEYPEESVQVIRSWMSKDSLSDQERRLRDVVGRA